MKKKSYLKSILYAFATLVLVIALIAISELQSQTKKKEVMNVVKSESKKVVNRYVDDGYKDEILFADFHTNITSREAVIKLNDLLKAPDNNFMIVKYSIKSSRTNEIINTSVNSYKLIFKDGKSMYFKITLNDFSDSDYANCSLDNSLGRYLNTILLKRESDKYININPILDIYNEKYGKYSIKKTSGYKVSVGLQLTTALNNKFVEHKPDMKYENIEYRFKTNKNLRIIYIKETDIVPKDFGSNNNYVVKIRYESTRMLDLIHKANERLKQKNSKQMKKQINNVKKDI